MPNLRTECKSRVMSRKIRGNVETRTRKYCNQRNHALVGDACISDFPTRDAEKSPDVARKPCPMVLFSQHTSALQVP
jgi:hypothetical protein